MLLRKIVFTFDSLSLGAGFLSIIDLKKLRNGSRKWKAKVSFKPFLSPVNFFHLKKSVYTFFVKLDLYNLFIEWLNKDFYHLNHVKWWHNGRWGIAPTWNFTHNFKNVINIFVCIKLFFLLTISFLYLIYSLGGYIRNKTRPRPPQIQF
jgi:hypothetical protein